MGKLFGQPVGFALDDGFEDLRLVAEMAIDRDLGDARAGGDGLDRDTVDAAFGKERLRGVEDRLAFFKLLGSSRRPQGHGVQSAFLTVA